jgi:CheY-like chemotaxis protein
MARWVLFVDDDDALRASVARYVQHYETSFRLLMCRDGVEAVETLQKRAVSIIVMDMVMPRMDGYELLAFLSKSFPHLPVIIQTGHAGPKLEKIALVRGVAEILFKPIHLPRLVETIQALLDRSASIQPLQSLSVGFFWGLIEADRKDCTLHVYNKVSKDQGTLYFRKGQLVAASCRSLTGQEAAIEITTWEEYFFYFIDGCPEDVQPQTIDQDVLPTIG